MTKPLDYTEVFAFMQVFPIDHLKSNNELIIDEDTDTFATIAGCESIEDVKARVVYAMCRPIGKGLNAKDAKRLLTRINRYYNVDLTRDDLRLMYSELCYPHLFDAFKRFIDRGFPVAELKPANELT